MHRSSIINKAYATESIMPLVGHECLATDIANPLQTECPSPEPKQSASSSQIASLIMSRQRENQAIIIVPAEVAAPHTIPFLPVRPILASVHSPAVYSRLLLAAYIDGILPREVHVHPGVLLQSEFWTSARLPSMEVAMEVLGLLQLDTVQAEERLVLHALKRLQLMMKFWQMERDGSNAKPEDMIAATGMVLASELVHALVNRKSFKLGESRWLTIMQDIQSGGSDALLAIAVGLPQILELADWFCTTELDSRRAHTPLPLLLAMYDRFRSWLSAYYAASAHEPHKESGVLHFASLLSFNFHSLYWICQILLTSAVMRIADTRMDRSPDDTEAAGIAEMSKGFATQYADQLFESLEYVLGATSGNISRAAAVRFPLHVLQLWYKQSDQYEKSAECVELEKSIRLSSPVLSVYIIMKRSPETDQPDRLEPKAGLDVSSRLINDSGTDSSHKTRLRSWNAPVSILTAVLVGLLIALAHHFTNEYLDGKAVDDVYISQSWITRIGTGLAFVAKLAFTVAVEIAFVQHQWQSFHRQTFRIDEVDTLTGALGNIFGLLQSTVWFRHPLLAFLVLIAWTIPIAAIVTPGALSVSPSAQVRVADASVPQPNFNTSWYAERQAGGSSAVPGVSNSYSISAAADLYKLGFTAAAASEPVSLSFSQPNQTYHLDFYGPAVKCAAANDSVIYNTTMSLGTNPYSGYTWRYASWVSDAYAAYQVAPSGNYYNLSTSERSRSPATVDYANTDAARIYVMTNTGNWNVTRRKHANGDPDASNIYTNPEIVQVNVTECLLYNASYGVDFEFQYPNQTRQITVKEWFHPVAAVGSKADELENIAYAGMMKVFGTLLVGTISYNHYSITSTLSTSWNIITIMDEYSEKVESGLEQLFQNYTLSLLSNDLFIKNASTGAEQVPVTTTTYPITYKYDRIDLLLPYGLSLLFALLSSAIGLRAFRINNASYKNVFSTFLRATNDQELRAAISIGDNGADPLGKDIAKLKITMGDGS
ncbi:hypothetical protein M409DRAFT_61436 [Zasmidium cellare ATCC 36951]|uniref:Uncharacterized protein n=1 Tax=Zasmidium cellare ATCC 36951 TaxID=1080233 RepID=A0A6A6BXR3_ZASCE|nr:uncharacterized protein M409DRAFT_61436 [Zasmidium cellare ATCC 36951]KAF2158720.1 hypothetical protein M409DRAFT_61436 [Zasmidium cellare ATCC 36951]